MAGAAPSPLVDDPADGRQPVDAERVLCLPGDHGRDGDGRRLLAVSPALVHQVQVAMHAGHLVGGEAVGALIVCGRRGAGMRAGARRPFLLARLLRGLPGGLGGSNARCGSAAGALRCRVSPKPPDGTASAAPGPAPARPRTWAAPAPRDTGCSPGPPSLWHALGNRARGLIINNNNNNNNSFRTGEQRHAQTRAALVHVQGSAGRKRAMDRNSLREESG